MNPGFASPRDFLDTLVMGLDELVHEGRTGDDDRGDARALERPGGPGGGRARVSRARTREARGGVHAPARHRPLVAGAATRRGREARSAAERAGELRGGVDEAGGGRLEPIVEAKARGGDVDRRDDTARTRRGSGPPRRRGRARTPPARSRSPAAAPRDGRRGIAEPTRPRASSSSAPRSETRTRPADVVAIGVRPPTRQDACSVAGGRLRQQREHHVALRAPRGGRSRRTPPRARAAPAGLRRAGAGRPPWRPGRTRASRGGSRASPGRARPSRAPRASSACGRAGSCRRRRAR